MNRLRACAFRDTETGDRPHTLPSWRCAPINGRITIECGTNAPDTEAWLPQCTLTAVVSARDRDTA